MSRAEGENLAVLCSALGGEIPQRADWTEILALANRTLVTPALAGALAERDDVPRDVREFLEHIATRVSTRNEAMRAQLEEAAILLTKAGVHPILLKGASFLANTPLPAGTRLFSDLDLLLPRSKADQALEALGDEGYTRCISSVASVDGITLKRDIDPGELDLHFRLRGLPGPPGYDEMMPFTIPAKVGGCKVLALVPSAQAAVLIAHDQIQERDYWRGTIDLRHLVDLHDIVRHHGPLDTEVLHRLFRTSASRRALDTQLLTANRLLGTPLPRNWRPSRIAGLQAKRREWQLAHPSAMPLLTAASLIADLPALIAPLVALPGWRHRARYFKLMFAPRKDTKA